MRRRPTDPLLALLLPFVALLIAYRGTLQFGLFSEDWYYATAHVRDAWAEFTGPGFDLGYRPVPVLIWAVLNRAFSDALGRAGGAFPYRCAALSIEYVNGALVYLVARQLGRGRYSAWSAGIACVTFVFNSTHSDVVNWVSVATSTAVCLTFLLLSSSAFFVWIEKKSPVAYATALMTFAIALLTKEYAIVLPGVLALSTISLNPRAPRRDHVLALIPFVLLLLGYLVAYKLAAGATPYFGVRTYVTVTSKVAANFGRKIADLVWPSIDLTPLGLATILAAVAATVALARRSAAIRIVAAWCVLTLLPAVHFLMPHHLYVASAGAAMLFGFIADELRLATNRANVGASLAVVCLVATAPAFSLLRLHERNRDWSAADEAIRSFSGRVENSCRAFPENATVYFTAVPDEVRGAWALRHGTNELVRFVCRRDDLTSENLGAEKKSQGDIRSTAADFAVALPDGTSFSLVAHPAVVLPEATFANGLKVSRFQLRRLTETNFLIIFDLTALTDQRRDSAVAIHAADTSSNAVLNFDQSPSIPTHSWLAGTTYRHFAFVTLPPRSYMFSVGLYDAEPPHSGIKTTAGDTAVVQSFRFLSHADAAREQQEAERLSDFVRHNEMTFRDGATVWTDGEFAPVLREAAERVFRSSVRIFAMPTTRMAKDAIAEWPRNRDCVVVRAKTLSTISGVPLSVSRLRFDNGIEVAYWNSVRSDRRTLLLRWIVRRVDQAPKPTTMFVHVLPQKPSAAPLNFDHAVDLDAWKVGQWQEHVIALPLATGSFVFRFGFHEPDPPYKTAVTEAGETQVESATVRLK